VSDFRQPRFPWAELVGYVLVILILMGALVWAVWPE
jgi:hypothetical protein